MLRDLHAHTQICTHTHTYIYPSFILSLIPRVHRLAYERRKEVSDEGILLSAIKFCVQKFLHTWYPDAWQRQGRHPSFPPLPVDTAVDVIQQRGRMSQYYWLSEHGN